MGAINGAIPSEWTEYVTQTGLGLEVIPAMLYSTKSYVSATTTVLTFFDTVAGSRPDLTNMQQSNMLPNPESFLLENIRIYFRDAVESDDSGAGDASPLDSRFNDIVQLVSRGILNFRIGNKQYGPFPLWALPANSFVKGAFASGSDLLANYGQVDGCLYALFPNLFMAPLQQFTVSLTWPGAAGDPIPGGAVTLSTGSESTINIEILFDGKMARSIQ